MKPSTPLPWQQGWHGKRFYIVAPDVHRNVIDLGAVREEDAAYIAHACNEYPKLVEDRARLVEALREHAFHGTQRGERAIALLRELGEEV